MHSVEKGDLSVAMLTARFLQLGYVVLKPITELSRYDLVIDRGNGFERVQCKTARTKGGTIRFNTASSQHHHKTGAGRRSYRGEVELFGAYCPEAGGTCLLVPVDQVGETEAVLRRQPPRNGQTKGVRLVDDYIL